LKLVGLDLVPPDANPSLAIEVRDDAGRVQNQAAVAAPQALAEGARDLMLQGEAEAGES